MEHYSAIKMEGLLIIHMTIWMNCQRMKLGFLGGAVVKNLPASAGDLGDSGFYPWVGKIPWRRKWQPTPAFMPGKFYGQRSLVGYNPRGCKQSDMSEQLISNVQLRISGRLKGNESFQASSVYFSETPEGTHRSCCCSVTTHQSTML